MRKKVCSNCQNYTPTDGIFGICTIVKGHVYKDYKVLPGGYCSEYKEKEIMGYQPSQPSGDSMKKYKTINGSVNDVNIVIVYGDIKGSVNNCDTVVIINGDVQGHIINCNNVSGLLADDSKRQDSVSGIINSNPRPTMRHVEEGLKRLMY